MPIQTRQNIVEFAYQVGKDSKDPVGWAKQLIPLGKLTVVIC
jgi:hypothetical protein